MVIHPRKPTSVVVATLTICTALLSGLSGLSQGAGASNTSTTQSTKRTPPARFQSAPCPQKSPPVPALANARCGYLVVPENRTKANGRTIRLAVAVIPATSPTPAPDPILFLNGGPGSDAFADIALVTDAGLNRDRELIVLAQRGNVNDNPSLTCPEIARFYTKRVGLVYDAPSTGRQFVQAAAACRRRLTKAGIDLSAYNTAENAADVADLRKTLGIRQWNIFGHSFGTSVGLVYMRDYPQGIRSVAFEGVTPPSLSTPGRAWPGVRQAFENMVAACAAQSACKTRYPNLRQTFLSLVNRLEAHPVTTMVTPRGASAPVKVVIDGGTLVNWMILETHFPAEFPLAVDELAHGNPQLVATRWASGRIHPEQDLSAYGMNFSTSCADEEPFETASQQFREGRQAFPTFPASVVAQAPQYAFIRQICAVLNVRKARASYRAVTRSTIPTLLEAGSFDAQTAAQWAKYAARTLPNSTVTIYSGQAHGVFVTSPCAASVIVSFFDNPKAPDTSCVASVQTAPFDTSASAPPPAESGGPLPPGD